MSIKKSGIDMTPVTPPARDVPLGVHGGLTEYEKAMLLMASANVEYSEANARAAVRDDSYRGRDERRYIEGRVIGGIRIQLLKMLKAECPTVYAFFEKAGANSNMPDLNRSPRYF